MLKCVFRDVIDHSNIDDYLGPDVVYYFHDDVTNVMYMVPISNDGKYYPFTHIVDESGFNVTYEEWCDARGLSTNK